MRFLPKKLTHINDSMQGWSRVLHGKEFIYRDEKGKVIRDSKKLNRIRKLAIPPAYTEVWICPSSHGYIQCTARDQKGRKQYKYHPRWQAHRIKKKFLRLLKFGRLLSALRQKVEHDLSRRNICQASVTAVIVRLLDRTALRIGNDDYAQKNGSYGLSTLEDRHVQIYGDKITFHFRGKSGVMHTVICEDRKASRIIRQCQEIPGSRLFQYIDNNGEAHAVHSDHVNGYIRAIVGTRLTAKDFRTWKANIWAIDAIRKAYASNNTANIKDIVQEVARRLGNTCSVCRKFYIHPEIFRLLQGNFNGKSHSSKNATYVHSNEIEFLKFLETSIS